MFQDKKATDVDVYFCEKPLPRRRRKKGVRKMREGSWKIQEQTLYLKFLKQNWNFMCSYADRKANKVFKKISEIIKTRTPVQVKSHHQKLEKKYMSTPGIITQLGKNIQRRMFFSNQQTDRLHFQSRTTQTKNAEFVRQEQYGDRVDIISIEENERLHLASFCSFFDEQSQNYGRIEEGIIMNENESLI